MVFQNIFPKIVLGVLGGDQTILRILTNGDFAKGIDKRIRKDQARGL